MVTNMLNVRLFLIALLLISSTINCWCWTSPTTTTTTTTTITTSRRRNAFLQPRQQEQPQQQQQGCTVVGSCRMHTTSLSATQKSIVNTERDEQVLKAANLSTAIGSVDKGTTDIETSTSSSSTTYATQNNYSYKNAILRTIAWVSVSVLFGAALWTIEGSTVGEEFFAGYLLEQSLSVDNLFVFLLLFEYFQVPLQYQDRVLNWGIYSAVVLRAAMIGAGAAALHSFREVLLIFAAILVCSSVNFFWSAVANGNTNEQEEGEEEDDPARNPIVQFSKKLFPSTDTYDGDNFFTMVDGAKKATPLFICLVAIEISDIVFAVDSIPAVFGVTEDPLVVFSSNMFAILGLRSLYTILSKAATDLKYLEPAVAVVLGFIGSKMVAEYLGYEVPTNIALSVVASLLGTGIGASIWDRRRNTEANNMENSENALVQQEQE